MTNLEEQLQKSAELAKRVQDAQREASMMGDGLADMERAEALGVPGAAERAATLRASKAAADLALASLRDKQQAADNKLRALTQQHEREREIERRKQVATLCPAYLKSVRAADAALLSAARHLEAARQIGLQLQKVHGSKDAIRVFSLEAMQQRLRRGLYMAFLIAAPVNENAVKAGFYGKIEHWWGYDVGIRGGDTKLSMVELTTDAVAQVQDVFLTEQEARHATARLDQTGLNVHVLPDPITGLFHLVKEPLRGEARRLATANKAGEGA